MKWSEIRKDKDFLKILLIFTGIIILAAGFTSVHLYFRFFTNFQEDYVISFFWILAIFPLILYIHYLKKLGWFSFPEIGLKSDNFSVSVLKGSVVGILLGLISWLILWLLNSPTGSLPMAYIIIFIFSSVFSAPIREEILTRGLIWSLIEKSFDLLSIQKKIKLNKKRKEFFTVLFVSLIFWSFHLGRPPDKLFTILLIDSFAYSLLYLKTRNLAAPITAHAISNLFIILRTIVF